MRQLSKGVVFVSNALQQRPYRSKVLIGILIHLKIILLLKSLLRPMECQQKLAKYIQAKVILTRK